MELDREIAKLKRDADVLHAKACAQSYIPAKDKMVEERNKILTRLTTLEAERNERNEEIAKGKIEKLFTENLSLTRLQSEREPIPIDKNLGIKIKLYPCLHETKMKIYDLIPVPQDSYHWQVLYEKWNSIFGDEANLSGRLNCNECRKAKQDLRSKLGRWNEKPIGSVLWKLRIFKVM